MTVQMAQARIKPENAAEVQAAAAKMFAAIEAAQPEGIRYAWTLLGDRETFVALVQIDEGVENPIPAIPEYQELQAHIGDWLAEPPESHAMEVVGSYRFF